MSVMSSTFLTTRIPMNTTARPTLSVPAGTGRRPYEGNAERRPFDQGAAPRKPSMIAKGHDAILKSLQDRSATIEIYPMHCADPIIGKMINRDRYTITVELDTGARRTVYKHAIESFGEAAAA
jgi:sRNA-binding regulator protein Hfq